MNLKELAKIQDSLTEQQKEEKRKKIQDALAKRNENQKKQQIKDALEKRRKLREQNAIADAAKYENFKITDSYKNICQKVMDALEPTQDTDAAIQAILALQSEEMPAEQLLAAVITVIGELVDILVEKVDSLTPPSAEVSDSKDNLDKVLKVIESYVDPIDPVEGGSVTITEDEIGVPITEELRAKVAEYLTKKFIPKEGTKEYAAWEFDGYGPQVSVELVDGNLEIEVWYNV